MTFMNPKEAKTAWKPLYKIGGIAAQIMFVRVTWAAATRINKPLTWWQKVLPENVRRPLGKLWPFTLTLGSISFLIGLVIAITGLVSGESDPERILSICWSFIFLGGLGMCLVTFVAGFAYDIQTREYSSSAGRQ